MAQPKQELRAVWLTTVGGLDWPHNYAQSTNSIRKQQQELCHILDLLKAAHVNTVLFQTRIRATVLYPSADEPWDGCVSGMPGTSPGYDPLQFAIEECHRRGMELHAWVVTIPIGKWNGAGARRLMQTHPRLVKRIGAEAFLNPEADGTADYLANLCGDITRRYDIDGIHLDYIRYPETWKITVNKSQGRHYITRIARAISQRVKSIKPWVKMSCSPIGKHDDLDRQESYGWNAFSRVCQDAQGWLRNGIMDQLYPMMYFDGKHFYPFASDWSDHQYQGQTAAGLGIYLLSPKERNWALDAVERQMNVARDMNLGHAYFRSKFLTDNTKGIYDFVSRFDSHLALTPAIHSSSSAPSAPRQLTMEHTDQGYHLHWLPATDNSKGDYLVYTIYASPTLPVDTSNPNNIMAIRYRDTDMMIKGQMSDAPLHFAVTAVDRFGHEGEAATTNETLVGKTSEEPLHQTLLHCNGTIVYIPQQAINDKVHTLYIYSMQGQLLGSYPASDTLRIDHLPHSIYDLRTSDRKGMGHVGYFVGGK